MAGVNVNREDGENKMDEDIRWRNVKVGMFCAAASRAVW
jgi:hypothetical protein